MTWQQQPPPTNSWQQPQGQQQHWGPVSSQPQHPPQPQQPSPPSQPQQWQQPAQPPQSNQMPQQAPWGGQQQGQWGGQQQQGQWGGQQQGQWGGQQGQWGGQQQGMCSCCDQCCQPGQQCCQQPGGQCCQQFPGQQVDPYCCGAPIPDQPDTNLCCDITCWTVGLFFILSLIGLAVVLGENSRDNIFETFNAATTRELDAAIESLIPYNVKVAALCAATVNASTAAPTTAPVATPGPTTNGTNATTTTTTTAAPTPVPTTPAPWVAPCTQKTLFGSFGKVCMEDTLNAGTFAANLSHWNNFRGTLYFLAFIITLTFMIVVYAVHRQKHPQGGLMNSSQQFNSASPNSSISLFGTDLYEVFRCAWFVSGFIVFFWVANAMTSFWTFSAFYKNNTEGKLHDFWVAYDKKFVASVVCVTLYLSWPIFLIGAEIGVWFVFTLPYMCVRCMLKPGIENIRPDMPMADMPGWVRADMFFMEAQQIRRLGFSHRLWEMVTGSKDAFCPALDCCQMGFAGMAGGPPQQWGPNQVPQQVPMSHSQRPVNPPRPGQMGDSELNRSVSGAQQQPQPMATMSSSFYPQESMAASAVVEVDGERKEKKEKKSKRDKSEKKEKGTKEKRDKTGTKDKKEKKHKKDKNDSD